MSYTPYREDRGSQTRPTHATIGVAGASRTLAEEDMRHPDSIWTDPSYAEYPLDKLRGAWETHLTGRPKPASPGTIKKYMMTMHSLEKSLKLHDDPLVLGSLTPFAVERWVVDMRLGRLPTNMKGRKPPKCREETIGSCLAALKAFTRKYVYAYQEMTTLDILRKVQRVNVDPKPKPGFTADQITTILNSYDNSPQDIRDRAMIAIYLDSGLRYQEVLWLRTGQVDLVTGEVRVITKGDKERPVCLSERGLRYLKSWTRIKPAGEFLFPSRSGTAFTWDGGQIVFKRLKKRTGISTIHAHRFRHTWTQTAIRKGAERQMVQDAMGWTSDAMARRYSGWVRQETAAKAMPRFSPLAS